jgi:hypothetical protein
MAKWTRDELTLTLDLYLRSNRRILEPHNPDLLEVRTLMNRLRLGADTPEGRMPRSGGSIKAKMTNFRAIDPDHPSTGWGNIGQADLDVWTTYAYDPAALSEEIVRIHHLAETDPT